jgi:hypothetical protein
MGGVLFPAHIQFSESLVLADAGVLPARLKVEDGKCTYSRERGEILFFRAWDERVSSYLFATHSVRSLEFMPRDR